MLTLLYVDGDTTSDFINTNTARVGFAADAIASAISARLATCGNRLRKLTMPVGALTGLVSIDTGAQAYSDPVEGRTANGYRYYSQTPDRAQWYMQRSQMRGQPVTPGLTGRVF